MKSLIVAASALIIASAPAFAGGYGHSQPTSPQFAAASAENFAVQSGAIKAGFNKGGIKQVAGASADAVNYADCGCSGSQTAVASAKNVSIQTAVINAGVSYGSISQSGVATASAKNFR